MVDRYEKGSLDTGYTQLEQARSGDARADPQSSLSATAQEPHRGERASDHGQEALHGQAGATLNLSAPESGQTIYVDVRPYSQLLLNFDIASARLQFVSGNVILIFPSGGQIVFVDLIKLAEEGKLPDFFVNDDNVPGETVAERILEAFSEDATAGEEFITAAGEGNAGGGASSYEDDFGAIAAGLDQASGLGETTLEEGGLLAPPPVGPLAASPATPTPVTPPPPVVDPLPPVTPPVDPPTPVDPPVTPPVDPPTPVDPPVTPPVDPPTPVDPPVTPPTPVDPVPPSAVLTSSGISILEDQSGIARFSLSAGSPGDSSAAQLGIYALVLRANFGVRVDVQALESLEEVVSVEIGRGDYGTTVITIRLNGVTSYELDVPILGIKDSAADFTLYSSLVLADASVPGIFTEISNPSNQNLLPPAFFAQNSPFFTQNDDERNFNALPEGHDYDPAEFHAALDGDDTVTLPSDYETARAINYNPSQIFRAGGGDDTVIGAELHDRILGGGGDDNIAGGTRGSAQSSAETLDDQLDGGDGNDTMSGDVFGALDGTQGDAGADLIKGNDGDDTIYGDAQTLSGEAVGGNDVVYGNDGDDTIYGDAAFLQGNAQGGDDVVEGGGGNDELWGDGARSDNAEGGNDIFRWQYQDAAPPASLGVQQENPARDVVKDFEIGKDKLDLSHILLNAPRFAGDFPPSVLGKVDYAAAVQFGFIELSYDAELSGTIIRIAVLGDGANRGWGQEIILEGVNFENASIDSIATQNFLDVPVEFLDPDASVRLRSVFTDFDDVVDMRGISDPEAYQRFYLANNDARAGNDFVTLADTPPPAPSALPAFLTFGNMGFLDGPYLTSSFQAVPHPELIDSYGVTLVNGDGVPQFIHDISGDVRRSQLTVSGAVLLRLCDENGDPVEINGNAVEIAVDDEGIAQTQQLPAPIPIIVAISEDGSTLGPALESFDENGQRYQWKGYDASGTTATEYELTDPNFESGFRYAPFNPADNMLIDFPLPSPDGSPQLPRTDDTSFPAFNAGPGDDSVTGGTQNETIIGDSGQDILRGEDGDDTLYGDAEVGSTYEGHHGDDVLIGGRGNDTSYGDGAREAGETGGRDIFVWRLEDLPNPEGTYTDTIQDFEVNVDKIEITGLLQPWLRGVTENGSTQIYVNYVEALASGALRFEGVIDGINSGFLRITITATLPGATETSTQIIDVRGIPADFFESISTDFSEPISNAELAEINVRLAEILFLGTPSPYVFTQGDDTVDLNNPPAFSVIGPRGIMNALDGDDTIFLPQNQAAAERISYDVSRTFYGGEGNDRIIGGDNNDIIDGGLHGDVIRGGQGDDVMTGGEGRDLFLWKYGDDENTATNPATVDTIKDFEVGIDKIDFVELLRAAVNADLSLVLENGQPNYAALADSGYITISYDEGSGGTTIEINREPLTEGAVARQSIVVENVDLTANGTLDPQDIADAHFSLFPPLPVPDNPSLTVIEGPELDVVVDAVRDGDVLFDIKDLGTGSLYVTPEGNIVFPLVMSVTRSVDSDYDGSEMIYPFASDARGEAAGSQLVLFLRLAGAVDENNVHFNLSDAALSAGLRLERAPRTTFSHLDDREDSPLFGLVILGVNQDNFAEALRAITVQLPGEFDGSDILVSSAFVHEDAQASDIFQNLLHGRLAEDVDDNFESHTVLVTREASLHIPAYPFAPLANIDVMPEQQQVGAILRAHEKAILHIEVAADRAAYEAEQRTENGVDAEATSSLGANELTEITFTLPSEVRLALLDEDGNEDFSLFAKSLGVLGHPLVEVNEDGSRTVTLYFAPGTTSYEVYVPVIPTVDSAQPPTLQLRVAARDPGAHDALLNIDFPGSPEDPVGPPPPPGFQPPPEQGLQIREVAEESQFGIIQAENNAEIFVWRTADFDFLQVFSDHVVKYATLLAQEGLILPLDSLPQSAEEITEEFIVTLIRNGDLSLFYDSTTDETLVRFEPSIPPQANLGEDSNPFARSWSVRGVNLIADENDTPRTPEELYSELYERAQDGKSLLVLHNSVIVDNFSPQSDLLELRQLIPQVPRQSNGRIDVQAAVEQGTLSIQTEVNSLGEQSLVLFVYPQGATENGPLQEIHLPTLLLSSFLVGGNVNIPALFGSISEILVYSRSQYEVGTLFTSNDDVVDFSLVTQDQAADQDVYNALDGDDRVYLPSSEDDWTRTNYDPNESFYGGGGNDIIYGGSAITTTIDGYQGYYESIFGGEGDDYIVGDNSSDPSADAGDDDIFGGKGNDILIGDYEDPALNSDEGYDIFYWDRGDDGFSAFTNGAADDQTPSAPAVDVVVDFQLGYDLLNIAELLRYAPQFDVVTVGNDEGLAPGVRRINYPEAVAQGFLTVEYDGQDTTVSIIPLGDGVVTQTIVVKGIEIDATKYSAAFTRSFQLLDNSDNNIDLSALAKYALNKETGGNDHFVFGREDLPAEGTVTNTIENFTFGEDRIDISDFLEDASVTSTVLGTVTVTDREGVISYHNAYVLGFLSVALEEDNGQYSIRVTVKPDGVDSTQIQEIVISNITDEAVLQELQGLEGNRLVVRFAELAATPRREGYYDFSAINARGGDDYVSLVDSMEEARELDLIFDGSPTGIHHFDGGEGDDRIIGRSLDDYIIGGQGNDVVSGGGGSDLFGWTSEDDYSALSAAYKRGEFDTHFTDVITDFDTTTTAEGDSADKDSIDVRELLINARRIPSAPGEDEEIDFQAALVEGNLKIEYQEVRDDNGDIVARSTVITIYPFGPDGPYQEIRLAGVDLFDDGTQERLNPFEVIDRYFLTEGQVGVREEGPFLFDNNPNQPNDAVDFDDFANVNFNLNEYDPYGLHNSGDGDDSVTLASSSTDLGPSFDHNLLFYGGDGNDTLIGRDRSDRIGGGFGDDIIDGAKGNDDLVGGAGNDFLTGGEGSDRFVFRPEDLPDVGTATDTVEDFTFGEDRLDIAALLAAVTDSDGVIDYQAAYDQGFLSVTLEQDSGGRNFIRVTIRPDGEDSTQIQEIIVRSVSDSAELQELQPLLDDELVLRFAELAITPNIGDISTPPVNPDEVQREINREIIVNSTITAPILVDQASSEFLAVRSSNPQTSEVFVDNYLRVKVFQASTPTAQDELISSSEITIFDQLDQNTGPSHLELIFDPNVVFPADIVLEKIDGRTAWRLKGVEGLDAEQYQILLDSLVVRDINNVQFSVRITTGTFPRFLLDDSSQHQQFEPILPHETVVSSFTSADPPGTLERYKVLLPGVMVGWTVPDGYEASDFEFTITNPEDNRLRISLRPVLSPTDSQVQYFALFFNEQKLITDSFDINQFVAERIMQDLTFRGPEEYDASVPPTLTYDIVDRIVLLDRTDGGSGLQAITGTEGDDNIQTISGEGNLVFSGPGDDNVQGQQGDDHIYGGSGNDTISGSGGDDRLHGNEGDDTISDEAGDNTLYGEAGDDTLSISGSGNNLLVGGEGLDRFVINTMDDGTITSHNTIADLEDGETLVLRHSNGGNPNDNVTSIVEGDNGATKVNFGSNHSLTFANIEYSANFTSIEEVLLQIGDIQLENS